MADVFVKHMRGLNSEERARLAAMVKSPFHSAHVRSAFELASAQRTSIEAAVKETLAATAVVQFEVVPGLVSGIELVVEGRKVAWSISDYMISLEKDVNELLKVRQRTEAVDTKPEEHGS